MSKYIDAERLLILLKDWRDSIPIDHRDPVVEYETLECVEDLVRALMRKEDTP